METAQPREIHWRVRDPGLQTGVQAVQMAMEDQDPSGDVLRRAVNTSLRWLNLMCNNITTYTSLCKKDPASVGRGSARAVEG